MRCVLGVGTAERKKRSRHEIYQHIDADYYGFRDEDDGLLPLLEAKAEEKGTFIHTHAYIHMHTIKHTHIHAYIIVCIQHKACVHTNHSVSLSLLFFTNSHIRSCLCVFVFTAVKEALQSWKADELERKKSRLAAGNPIRPAVSVSFFPFVRSFVQSRHC